VDESITIVETADGSHTLYSKQFDEIYHSRNGAITESLHVFIKNGIERINKPEISVLEVGFGTGLNAWLTWRYAEQHRVKVHYFGTELYPISIEMAQQLNFNSELNDFSFPVAALHACEWEQDVVLSPYFTFHKTQQSFLKLGKVPLADVIYFDAFAPEKQPELWELPVFEKCFAGLNPGGILSTYCAKGYVQRNMKQASFKVEKTAGPPGKREMLVALK